MSGLYSTPSLAAGPTRVRYAVVASLCVAAVIAYVHRSCLAVPAKTIQTELGLTPRQMGWVMSSFFVAYALFQVPGGWLADVWGTRRALAMGALLWSLATGLMGFAGGFVSLCASCTANGMAQAGIFPCSVKTIAQWVPATHRAFPTGLIGSCQSLGAVVASVLVAFLLGFWTWQVIFVVLAVPGILWAASFYLWFRDEPRAHAGVNAAEVALIEAGSGAGAPLLRDDAEAPPLATPWLAILTSPTLAWLCGQQLFRAAGYVFYQSWFPTYLQQTRGVSVQASGYLTSLPLLAFVLGLPLGGGLVDWILKRTGSLRLSRQVWAMACMLVCGVLILLAYFVERADQAVLVISAGSFCAALGGPTAYVLTIDLGGRHVATVFSVMNTAGNVGASLCPIVIAWLVEGAGSWHAALLFCGSLYLAAALCWLFLNPTRPILENGAASISVPR